MDKTRPLIKLVFLLLLFTRPSSLKAQVAPVALQHLQVTDKLLSNYLANFWTKVDDLFISVIIQVDPKDNGYIYQLDPIHHLETVESFSSSRWGQWRGKIILFYGLKDLTTICHISDTTAIVNLKQYASRLLPRAVVYKKGSNDVRMGVFIPGPSAKFKLLKGREVYYSDNSGYDSREVPEELPPVPESGKKH